ncbi:hypothetical protein GLOIN_2v1811257 [Rhizophagus irregularis DAOM 181602=DAOM 197198]|nr:hypothetical protein GLOIN_2v1811257 [Rhizophagus irregularis DAOM 181602=DAOM 197198]
MCSKGKIPRWFKELEDKLMKNDQREVFACYELISEVYDLYNNNVILRDSWKKFNEIYIGREYDDLIEFDNRFKLIEKCFVGGQGFRLLEKEYLDLVDVNQSDLKIYTDGSKKEYVNGIGWVIFNGDKILSKGRLKIKGNYEVWELELVAIVAALMIVNKGSSVKIITDSKIVKDLWDKLVEVKNGIWSTRRIWNVKFSGIWKWVRYVVKYLDLNISVYKIKGHSGDLGNEMADSLSKLALRETEGSLITYLNIPEDMSWEYNLYWRRELIKEAPRDFMKEFNQRYYKAAWLSLDVSRTLRVNILDAQIDWKNSYMIIMEEYKGDITDSNNKTVAYKLKNFLEILPTMTLLNKRNPEVYRSGKCVRCQFMMESWTHLWICKENETSIIQIINQAFEILKEKLDNQNFRLDFNYYARLLQILNDRSYSIFNGRIFHEAIKGMINSRLYLNISDPIFTTAIKGFVRDIHILARDVIWVERCKEVNKWERSVGISRIVKKNCKLETSSLPSIGSNSKHRNQFIYDVSQRWLGSYLANMEHRKNLWFSLDISDLWSYHNLVKFRSSKYALNYSILD